MKKHIVLFGLIASLFLVAFTTNKGEQNSSEIENATFVKIAKEKLTTRVLLFRCVDTAQASKK